MYNVTETFLEKVTENSRAISGKLYLGDLELTDEDLITMDMEYSLGNDSIPAIGGVVSSRLNVKLFRDKLPPVFTTQELKPYLGLEISKGNIEYIPMGVYRINPRDTVKTDKTVSLVGYDILFLLEDSPYESSLTFPTTWNDIKTELETKGLKFKAQTLPKITIKEKPNTIRELLSNVAELLGMNVVTNRLGEIEFRQLNTTIFVTDNYNSFKLLADDEVKLTRLTVEKEEEKLTYGNDIGFTIKIKNDSITTGNELAAVYNRVFPLSYIAYECNLQGLPHLDVGDIIKLIDRHGVERNIPIAYHKISYSGGLRSEIRANAPDGAISSTGSTGSRSITQSLNDLRVNILEVNYILADKADINLVVANEARINDLYAVKANISDLQATNARIDVLEIGYADISVLEADVAKINTLLAGNLDATNMKTGLITATSGLIANAAITNAMIANVSADKINAGTINTNNITVRSNDGNLRIQGNTLKVWDNTGKERVSLGLNDTDYNLLIRGKDGQTVLFGADGVTNAGITEGAVDDSKVAPNANISGDKLNISSVVTAINNGVTKIESSNINYDGKSLNVAFGELKTSFNNLEIGGRNLVILRDTETGKWIEQSTGEIGGSDANHSATGFMVAEGSQQYVFSGNSRLRQVRIVEYDENKGYIKGKLYSGYHDNILFKTATNTKFIRISGDNNRIGSGSPVDTWKLEKGNKATDWTPAPEDVQTNIETRVKITDFKIEQGRINTLISDVSTIEGEVNSTKSRVSTIEQTADYIINTLTYLEVTAETTESNLSQLTQDVNSFKATVSETYATKNELSTKESEIKQYADQVGISVTNTVAQTYETKTGVDQKINTAKGEIKVTTDEISSRVTNVENTINTITPHSIILSNESFIFMTNHEGINTEQVILETKIGTYKGTNRVDGVVRNLVVVERSYFGDLAVGAEIPMFPYGSIGFKNPTTSEDGYIRLEIVSDRNFPEGDVFVGFDIVIEEERYGKEIPIRKAKPGVTGEPAKLVKIIPSNLYFIRDKNGIAPNNITLTPNFQNTTYQKWEYSTNGTTWTQITRTTSSTTLPWMNSTTRVLTVPKAWSVISNNDYVVFRITTTTGEMDVQTISILYDVTELEGRVSSAEQKITPSAIMNTVQSEVSKGGTTIAQKSDITQTMDEWVAKFDYLKAPVPFRYVRSSMQELNGMAGWCEIEVFANGVNVALGKTVTGNGIPMSSNFDSEKYTDGSKNTKTIIKDIPTGEYGWLQVDLGQVYDNVESIIDYTSVSEGTKYNYKLEVSEDGIKWYTIFDGTKDTSVNSFALSGFQQGITTINADGVKVEHSGSNEWSMIRHDGFVRKWENGESGYLNDIWVETYEYSGRPSSSKPSTEIVYLPSRFKNRGDDIEIFLTTSKLSLFIGLLNGSRVENLTNEIRTVLKWRKGNFNTNSPIIYVDSYFEQDYQWDDGKTGTDYGRLGFTIIVIGG